MIQTIEQLEDLLSQPNEHDIAAMGKIEGDILVLGASGKMGPTLAMRAQRACKVAGLKKRVIAVARFTNPDVATRLQHYGVEVIGTDLLQTGALEELPDIPNVIFMAAMKFGTTGGEHLTWAMNTLLPGRVAERYRNSRIAVFSSGNVYPLVPITSGGATEETEPVPVGEYAQSVLGRERLFEYASLRHGIPAVLLRVNYANELRYGVLLDIGMRVFQREPVDIRMPLVNVIWQGDANSMCLRSLLRASTPPLKINITGPETLSVRWIAEEFGKRFGVEPQFDGVESNTALLSNSSLAMRMFGYPKVSPARMIEWMAAWIGAGGAVHGKPTHFETRDGRF